jgi:hypothetical protein
MNKPLIDSENAVVPHLHPAEVLQPGDGALDFPAAAITAQLAFVLIAPQNAVGSVRHDQFDASSFQPPAHGIAIVAAVGHHSLGVLARTATPRARDSHLRQRAFRQFVLRRFRGRELHSQRKALAIDHHHALRALPAHGFAHSSAPFFATMKVASKKTSSQSNNLRRSMSANSCCQARNQTPSSSQARNRRQQVAALGYFLGRSRQRAPVRSTHKIPSQQARLGIQGRPRCFRRLLGDGKNTSIRVHCLSVSICRQPTTMPLRRVSTSAEAEPIYETSSTPSSVTDELPNRAKSSDEKTRPSGAWTGHPQHPLDLLSQLRRTAATSTGSGSSFAVKWRRNGAS